MSRMTVQIGQNALTDAADLGRCLSDLGETGQALKLSAAALRDYEQAAAQVSSLVRWTG